MAYADVTHIIGFNNGAVNSGFSRLHKLSGRMGLVITEQTARVNIFCYQTRSQQIQGSAPTLLLADITLKS